MSLLNEYYKNIEDVSRQSYYLLGYLNECLKMFDEGSVDSDFVIESLRIQLEKLSLVCKD